MFDLIIILIFIVAATLIFIKVLLNAGSEEQKWKEIYRTQKDKKEKAKAFFRKNHLKNERKRKRANDKFNWLIFKEKAKPLFVTFAVYVAIRVYVVFFMLPK